MSKLYGLIGEHLTHSYSKQIHEALGGYPYELLPLAPAELSDFMKKKEFQAINVTIPYKRDVIPFLDAVDEKAAKIGAVNTIVNRNGILTGYNTDYDGFLYSLQKNNIETAEKTVLVLGNGGAAQAVFAVLKSGNAKKIAVIKQHPEEGCYSYEKAAELFSDADIIVNTSPVGMYPDTERSPMNLAPYSRLSAVIDLIYNPSETKLLAQARSMGIPTVNGGRMLVAQAFFAAELFLDRKLSTDKIESVYTEIF